MPELPEAETIVRGLRPHLPGRTIVAVECLHADVIEGTETAFTEAVSGAEIQAVDRRGKNLVLALDGNRYLVVNLGMSGRLLHRTRKDSSPRPTHPAVRFTLAPAESDLVYHDVRRFGRLSLYTADTFRVWSASLGPEPLGPEFTEEWLTGALSRSRMPLRSWLLDQRKVAGVGNIYASEAAHRAGIHPRTRVRQISTEAAAALHTGIRSVLAAAIEARGTTLRDYRTAQGWEGEYAGQLRVYGRDGEPCPECGEPIQRIVFSNRSAFFCPRCQPEF